MVLKEPLQNNLLRQVDWPSADRIASSQPKMIHADARTLPLESNSVDLIVTSPPYWRKRDYSAAGQLGVEDTPELYASNLRDCLSEWGRVLLPHGSVFLNVGDTYHNQALSGIPFLVEGAARTVGWTVRNRIIWAKKGGIPEPSQRRLASRHEYILHFVRSRDYYYDAFAYSQLFWNGTTPGDVWQLQIDRNMQKHLAPYPEELVERVLALAAPFAVCQACKAPRTRIIERTFDLDLNRPQARRAIEIANRAGLTEAHLRAIQSTGISDAGKAQQIQTGTNRNAAHVKALAGEAKEALGGYFREFTFGKKKSGGFTRCKCDSGFRPGIVVDPFAGTGTTMKVASRWGLDSIGFDLAFDAQATIHFKNVTC